MEYLIVVVVLVFLALAFIKPKRDNKTVPIDDVARILTHHFAMSLTEYGSTIAIAELMSGHAPMDVASHIATLVLAEYVVNSGDSYAQSVRWTNAALVIAKRMNELSHLYSTHEVAKNDIRAVSQLCYGVPNGQMAAQHIVDVHPLTYRSHSLATLSSKITG